MASAKYIRELVEPVLTSVGLQLWDVEVSGDVVRVMVERPEPGAGFDACADDAPRGVDLDDLSRASAALSPLLDLHPEAVPAGRYQLEVSSPGIERTLRTPEQFQRYTGTEITVKTSEPVAGARRHRGRLVETGPEAIILEPGDAPGDRLQLRYNQMDRARTVMVWGAPADRPRTGRAASGRPGATTPASARRAAAPRTATAPNPKDAGS